MSGVDARIVAQRLRNNVMRQLAEIAQGDNGVRQYSFQDYFEDFFDEVPYDGLYPNDAMTSDEIAALSDFLAAFRQACDATPRMMTEEAFIQTGWPARLAPKAAEALAIFTRRGFLDQQEIDLR